MIGRSRAQDAGLGTAAGRPPGLQIPAAFLLCCISFLSASGQAVPAENSKPSSAAVHQHSHNDTPTSQRDAFSTPAAAEATAASPGVARIGSQRIAIPDVVVLDRYGKRKHFYSDLFKDKVVVLTFFYTSCVNVCPTLSLALSKLQTNLGDRLGKDVFVVSVTKDPETDTPAKLKAWAKAQGVKTGWTLVTGELSVIGKIVRDFTGLRLGQDSHGAYFLLGNDRTGNWTDISGYSTPEELRQEIDKLMVPAKK